MNNAAILLADDAPQVAGILLAKLTREGHRVRWVRSSEAARLALAQAPCDLVLLSTSLAPPGAAWVLLAELRGAGRRVGMLLEAEEAPERERALGQGACLVILKPFKPTVVARQLAELAPA